MFEKGNIIEYQGKEYVICKTTGKQGKKKVELAKYKKDDDRFLTKMNPVLDFVVKDIDEKEIKVIGKYKRSTKKKSLDSEKYANIIKIDRSEKQRVQDEILSIRERELRGERLMEEIESKDPEVRERAQKEARELLEEIEAWNNSREKVS